MENQSERCICPGEIYRHFKGKLYQIVAVAIHSETGERMVVYQALYGDFRVYVRPFVMFVSEVEREKYPEAEQRYRFERVSVCDRDDGEKEESEKQESEKQESEKQAEEAAGPNQALMAFLDAGSLEERITCLREMRRSVSQADLDSICVVLDMQGLQGSVTEQLDEVIRRLALQRHYEGGRLR